MAKYSMSRVVVMLAGISFVLGQDTKYMDSRSYCGQTYRVGDQNEFFVVPRGPVTDANPITQCTITFESAYTSNNYKFELVMERITFGTDCGMMLKIYDGSSVGGLGLQTLGCGTASTGKLYPKSQAVTFYLTRTRVQYDFSSDFQIRVRMYYDPSAADNIVGTSRFPAGAIVGVVLGVIVLVAAGILLGWCYKTGRLPGMDPYSYPAGGSKAGGDNFSRMDGGDDGTSSTNGGFKSWHNTESKTVTEKEPKSHFDMDDSRMWESLTNISSGGNSAVNANVNKPVLTKPPPLRPVPIVGKSVQNKANTNSQRLDPSNLSNSPKTRVRGRGESKTDPYNTINDNFSRDANERDSGNSGNSLLDEIKAKRNSFGVFVNPDKEGYLYDYDQVKKLEGDQPDKTVEIPKTQDFGSELRNAIRKSSLRRAKSDTNTSDSDANGKVDSNASNDSSAFNSTNAVNKTDGETTGPEAQSSPKPTKKKRKSSKERKSKKQKDDKSPLKSPKKNNDTSNDTDASVPPEVYQPIFSEDENNDISADYSHMYQPGYQGPHQPMPMYDPRYPMGPYPPGMQGMYPPGVPYQQAGQAQWYMEADPNGQHKMAFAMQTHSQSDAGSGRHHGEPNFTSTPYKIGNRPNQSALVPAGTILDDPEIPQPGTSLMRYGEDPLSGVKTSQVVWTDARRDPTDPPPDSSSQVTRKTITRITTRATKDELPDHAGPSLQDMSWQAAQNIQASGGHEPAFMSPTRAAYQANAIQYANETPDRSNASYYTGGSRHPPRSIAGPPPPVIHEEPDRNTAFRDRIVLNNSGMI
ncbi:uncharacterized protein LOC127881616 isoform X2 [Dreissena polymorpha]|uniref:uncharacterized protein LOC127881616 isoform X2 n=1 Tax=Dreissena polymorpha TaxID=45954 RepID=UPI002264E5D6|nr:uncharacterized protein LOC127881616 isoform X2 [Dreissena polymorpha]